MRNVQLPEDSLAFFYEGGSTFHGVRDRVLMWGYNSRPDGVPVDPAEPKYNLQLEYHYRAENPDGTFTDWLEYNFDYAFGSVKRRFSMFKTVRDNPDKFMDWRFCIGGDGKFHISLPSNIDEAGKDIATCDQKGNFIVIGGFYIQHPNGVSNVPAVLFRDNEVCIGAWGYVTNFGSYTVVNNNTYHYGSKVDNSGRLALIGLDNKNQTSVSPQGQNTVVGGALKAKSLAAENGVTEEVQFGRIKLVIKEGIIVKVEHAHMTDRMKSLWSSVKSFLLAFTY